MYTVLGRPRAAGKRRTLGTAVLLNTYKCLYTQWCRSDQRRAEPARGVTDVDSLLLAGTLLFLACVGHAHMRLQWLP